MYYVGLDIGTTTVSATAVSCDGSLPSMAVTLKNDSFISGKPFERLQDPKKIAKTIGIALGWIKDKCGDNIRAIGVTGQMHGILYLNSEGNCLSPLYIWQDGRGNEPYEGGTYCSYITSKTGYPASSGFGLVTHFYNLVNGLVPEGTAKLCTIHDYAVMCLTGRTSPLIHASDAASLGLYNIEKNAFDLDAVNALGMDASILPDVTEKTVFAGISRTQIMPGDIPVSVAIGDNQASFLGSAEEPEGTLLVNMGTGSQVSVMTDSPKKPPIGEIRPFINGKYLFVGSSLCGGRAYQILSDFFASCAPLFGVEAKDKNLFKEMDLMSEAAFELTDALDVSCEFCGTRADPSKRASVTNISADNFTAQQLICGVLRGTVAELYGMYEAFRAQSGCNPKYLIGSGNGIRKSEVWQKLFSEKFGSELAISNHKEEASRGAALFAGLAYEAQEK